MDPPKKKLVYKKEGWEPIQKKYKANKGLKTQVIKEHNNQDTTNILIK
jgi:hypothetical protein